MVCHLPIAAVAALSGQYTYVWKTANFRFK